MSEKKSEKNTAELSQAKQSRAINARIKVTKGIEWRRNAKGNLVPKTVKTKEVLDV